MRYPNTPWPIWSGRLFCPPSRMYSRTDFRRRPLGGAYPYQWRDALYLTVRTIFAQPDRAAAG